MCVQRQKRLLKRRERLEDGSHVCQQVFNDVVQHVTSTGMPCAEHGLIFSESGDHDRGSIGDDMLDLPCQVIAAEYSLYHGSE